MNKDYFLGNVSITYTVDESTSWAGYRLDEQKLVTITGNTTLIGLASGIHNITLYARDTSGNSGISETGMFSVDKPEPFPAGLFVVAVVVIIVCAGLLVYLKKNKRAP